MEFLFSIVLLLVINQLILFLQTRHTPESSDHYFHVGLISAIRNNKYKFIEEQPNLLGRKYFNYPQLFHWLLAFAGPDFINKHSMKIGLFLSQLNLICFIFFGYYLQEFLNITSLPLYQFLIASGVVFIFTPFNFVPWNPKNRGISARGLGVLLGNIYIYITILYILSPGWEYFAALFVVTFIITIASIFTHQYLFFSIFIFSAIFLKPELIVLPFVAYLAFYIMTPKVAKNWLLGSLGHKFTYSKYLAAIFILKSRYSIWRDLVFDIWKKAFIEKKKSRAIHYFLTNPMIQILLTFPFFTFLAINYYDNYEILIANNPVLAQIFVSIILSNFVLFILTSFRITRFLGEPERYFEYSIPLLSIFAVYLFADDFYTYAGLLFFSFLMIAYNLNWFRNPQQKKSKTPEHISKLLKRLQELKKDSSGKARFFGNNNDLPKYLLSNSITVLRPDLSSFYTGSLHFKDIFADSYGYVVPGAWITMIKEFGINYFILDTNIVPRQEIEKTGLQFTREENVENFVIFHLSNHNS